MKINEIVWDRENKEYVKISNGIPVVEGKPEITPTEAVALRIIGFSQGGEQKPCISFTYRKVKAEYLLSLNGPLADDWMIKILESKTINKHFNFLGRV